MPGHWPVVSSIFALTTRKPFVLSGTAIRPRSCAVALPRVGCSVTAGLRCAKSASRRASRQWRGLDAGPDTDILSRPGFRRNGTWGELRFFAARESYGCIAPATTPPSLCMSATGESDAAHPLVNPPKLPRVSEQLRLTKMDREAAHETADGFVDFRGQRTHCLPLCRGTQWSKVAIIRCPAAGYGDLQREVSAPL
jgi:hypothetical protein